MDKLLKVSSLCGGYGSREVLRNIDLSVEKGEVLALLGANGCGKTTFIKSIAGLLPYSGSVKLHGIEVAAMSQREAARSIGYLGQKSGSALPMTCLEILLLGFNPELPLLSSPTAEMRKKAATALEELGIGHLLERDFTSLSEGQKQLVLLARTIMRRPPLLLLDEPDSALDFTNRVLVMKKLRELAAGGAGVLLCSHDVNFALRYADRLLFMKDGSIAADISAAAADKESLEKAFSAALPGVRVYDTEDGFVVGAGL